MANDTQSRLGLAWREACVYGANNALMILAANVLHGKMPDAGGIMFTGALIGAGAAATSLMKKTGKLSEAFQSAAKIGAVTAVVGFAGTHAVSAPAPESALFSLGCAFLLMFGSAQQSFFSALKSEIRADGEDTAKADNGPAAAPDKPAAP